MWFSAILILLPISGFLIAWLALRRQSADLSVRDSFVRAIVAGTAFVVVVTESLSLLSVLGFVSISLVWVAAVSITALFFRRDLADGSSQIVRDLRSGFGAVPPLFAGIGTVILAVTLVLALVSPPNTYDSLTYHMARIAHWIQNGTVAFYPTAILRQLYQPPLAEYAILHFQVLTGGDHFANLVQWLAFPACAAVVSLILREFGCELRTQAFGAVLVLTLPGAIVQSSSTQNDLLASFFVGCFYYFFLRAARRGSADEFVWAGLALGAAVLTKATSYLYCFPIGLYFCVVRFLELDRQGRGRFVRNVAILLVLGAAVNVGHYARNQSLFGAPVTSADDDVRIRNLTVRMVAANVARNYAVNLGTGSATLRGWIEGAMQRAFGAELKNPNSTWLENKFEVRFSSHEDSAGNFVHILLITIALIPALFVPVEGRRYLAGIAFTIGAGFLLFSALLKWQIWTSRLHLPLFVLGCVPLALFLSRRWPRLPVPVSVVAFAAAIPFLFFADPRRVFSDDFRFVLFREARSAKYFRNLPDTEPLFREAVEVIRQRPPVPESVGLAIEYNDFDYPVWVLLKDDPAARPRIVHVDVGNVSKRLVGSRPRPEFVISIREGNKVEGEEYEEIWKKDIFRVLKRKTVPTPAAGN